VVERDEAGRASVLRELLLSLESPWLGAEKKTSKKEKKPYRVKARGRARFPREKKGSYEQQQRRRTPQGEEEGVRVREGVDAREASLLGGG
jgi:hypothetical protein